MRSFFILLLLLIFVGYLIINRNTVSVIDAHYDGHTAQVIVYRLPFFGADKIIWWEKNKEAILQKYHIPSGQDTPFQMTIYAFGDGYKEEGTEDRRCFPDVRPPENCIDKDILMTIRKARSGESRYSFH